MAAFSTMLLSLWVLLLAEAGCLGGGRDRPEAIEANLESITDDILAGVDKYATEHNLTTLPLPDVEQDFSATLWILSITGTVHLTGGKLSNFQRLRRYHGSSAIFIPKDRHCAHCKPCQPGKPGVSGEPGEPVAGPQPQLVVHTGVELPILRAEYLFEARVGVVKQKGTVSVTVSGTKATTMLCMGMDTLKPYMGEFNIDNLGKLRVDVQDGVVGWLATPVANLVLAVARRTLVDLLEEKIPELANDALSQIDIPAMLRPPADLQ